MVDRIAWLHTAKLQYRQVVDYMFEHYSEQRVDHFNEEIDRRLERLVKQPLSGRPSQIEGVRYVLLKKRWHLYYRLANTTLYILFIWDTRRNPKKNPYRDLG